MGKPSVRVEGVGKKFGLSLKSALKYGLTDTLRRGFGRGKDIDIRPGEFWALQDVDFSLEPGDALGIMGINGSGKTTLLRILNGTYSPDRGKVSLRGRVGALIAAGAGFSPMLTGRENVFISASLLGMRTEEVRRRFDEIVAFAELEDFIDMPVRNYSSGMSVRLGFAVAVLGSPDILLVDEVLAVGDINFQKKCFERIHAIQKEGTTILLVSHSPGAIWAVCNKGLVLHHGCSGGVVNVEQACKEYENFNLLERKSRQDKASNNIQPTYDGLQGGTGDAVIDSLEIVDDKYLPIDSRTYGVCFTLRLHITAHKEINDAIVRVLIDSEINKAISVIDNYELDQEFFHFLPGNYIVDIKINKPNLRPGVYTMSAAIIQQNAGVHLFYAMNLRSLSILQGNDLFFYADYRASVHLDGIYSIARVASPDQP